MNEIELSIKKIKINSELYSLIFQYYLNDIKNLISGDDDKKRLYNFFEKICNLLTETDFLNIKNDLDTFPQKVRIQLEYIQYLKFICCSKDLEEIYYKALIYELSYSINLYQYFIELHKITIELINNNYDENEFLAEKEKRLNSINELYKKIVKNKYYKGSILSKKIKQNQKDFFSLNDKNLKKINELYWYSLCSDYKTMNELFLVLTYNYQNHNGYNFEVKNLKEEIDFLIESVNHTFDPDKTRNKKNCINPNEKTLGTLISELNDILKNPKKKKKLKPDIQNRILALENIRNISKFKNIIYGILSYKIHMCDIFDIEENIYKNSILYYKTFYSTEMSDLIFRFIDIFYENENDNELMKYIAYSLKIIIDMSLKSSQNLVKKIEVLEVSEKKIQKNNKYWNKYKIIKNELIKIVTNYN